MSIVFILLSAVLLASALGVILMKNAIHSALCLVVHLVGVACVFAALDAHFLAVVQIIVYAGAIMVLVLFVLMLLNTKSEERDITGVLQFLIAGGIAVFFIALVSREVLNQWPVIPQVEPTVVGTVSSMGLLLYSKYLIPFEAAGLLIMAALVGAAMLAKTVYRVHSQSDGEGE